jgi:hypothetical protein
MTLVLPAGWTSEDVQFLIEKVRSWPVVLIEDQALGIPTTQSIPPEAISDWGYGVLKATTEEYTVLFEITRTPSGKGWAHVDVISGSFSYNKITVLERLASLIETHFENADVNEATPVPKLSGLVESKESAAPKTGNTPAALENNKPVQTLTFLEEGRRLIAHNEFWMAICCSSVDRGTGEIKCGQWRMYHANFIGVLDPITNQQVYGPDVWTVMKRTTEIYGVQMELEGVPDWIMLSQLAVSDLPVLLHKAVC